MRLSGHYDSEFEMLAMWTGEKELTGASGLYGLVFFVGAEDTRAIVGFELLAGAKAYLEMKEGYDADNDTLSIGEWAEDPAWRGVNGDLIASWREVGGIPEPIGVILLNAKANMANVEVD